jgi:hypothetical protein
MLCEWCGNQATDQYTVVLPDGCSFPVCRNCVDAGEARGGGTAFCHDCFKVIPIRLSEKVVTYWRPHWYRRRIRITSWKCKDGCEK